MRTVNIVERSGGLKIEIDAYELMHYVLTDEHRDQLIESLACHDKIIEYVAMQLVEGYTPSGFCGKWSSDLSTPLQKARLLLAKNHDYAAKKTIEDLEFRIKSLNDDVAYLRKHLDECRSA